MRMFRTVAFKAVVFCIFLVASCYFWFWVLAGVHAERGAARVLFDHERTEKAHLRSVVADLNNLRSVVADLNRKLVVPAPTVTTGKPRAHLFSGVLKDNHIHVTHTHAYPLDLRHDCLRPLEGQQVSLIGTFNQDGTVAVRSINTCKGTITVTRPTKEECPCRK